MVSAWSGEYLQNLHLQIHPDFIPMTSRIIIRNLKLHYLVGSIEHNQRIQRGQHIPGADRP